MKRLLTLLGQLITVRFETGWATIEGAGVVGGAYASGDAVGVGQAVQLPAEGEILEVEYQDAADQAASYEVAFFAQPNATAPTDNSAFAPTDADLTLYQGHINIAASDLADWSLNRAGTTFVPSKQFRAVDGRLYVYWIARSTPTLVATTPPAFRFRGRKPLWA